MSKANITAIIVDDEMLARSIIREYLAARPEVTVVAECANGFEAVKAVAELKPDLMFLDIQMPKLSGFEVIELLETPPAVVFVTAFDQYAVQAFNIHAVDYLLKPYTQERFLEALDHVQQRLAAAAPPPPVKAAAEEAVSAQQPLERLLIKEGSKVLIIPAEKIDYI
ncbi:MAG: response regulator, partial [Bacteroidetes bacterium]|nr:response regulator [Bacteroidota bacterium]